MNDQTVKGYLGMQI